MCEICRENMRDIDNGQTTYISLLLYGEIFSYRAGIGRQAVIRANWGLNKSRGTAMFLKNMLRVQIFVCG